MPEYRFSHPIEVRYADLDPQGHVNNANFLTFIEQARVHYLMNLGLYRENQSFQDVGIILAEAQVTFLAPILFGMPVLVELRVSRLGNKSLSMLYRMVNTANGVELAIASTTLVTFDYHSNKTIPIPDLWREKISEFEGL
jgi:acyl-CoA thioester hydrolase